MAKREGGFVMRSSVSPARASGTVELRVPARRLDATLADLARLGEVRSRVEPGRQGHEHKAYSTVVVTLEAGQP
jgi:hypothetical protein